MNQRLQGDFRDEIARHILDLAPLDAIYLYGSRAKGCARKPVPGLDS